MTFRASLEWQPRDCWVGIYIDPRERRVRLHNWSAQGHVDVLVSELHVWICLIPMLPLHLVWSAAPAWAPKEDR